MKMRILTNQRLKLSLNKIALATKKESSLLLLAIAEMDKRPDFKNLSASLK